VLLPYVAFENSLAAIDLAVLIIMRYRVQRACSGQPSVQADGVSLSLALPAQLSRFLAHKYK